MRETRSFTYIQLCCIFLSVAVFSQPSFAQRFVKDGNTVTYKGNKFEFPNPLSKTKNIYINFHAIDSVKLNRPVVETYAQTQAVKMNGNIVYRDGITQRLSFSFNRDAFENYLLNGISEELDQLQDGVYKLNLGNIVFDTTGKVVYYDYRGLIHFKTDPPFALSSELETRIIQKVERLMIEAKAGQSAELNGKKAPVCTDIPMYDIFVKSHKAIFEKRLATMKYE